MSRSAAAPHQLALHVGNLAFSVSESDLKRIFGKCGEVNEVKLMTDPRTKESRGFGFVNMAKRDDGLAAIKELHNHTVDGRQITVLEAKRQSGGHAATPGRYMGPPNDRSRIDNRGSGIRNSGYSERSERDGYNRDRDYSERAGRYDRDRYDRAGSDRYDRGYSDRYDRGNSERSGGYSDRDRYDRDRYDRDRYDRDRYDRDRYDRDRGHRDSGGYDRGGYGGGGSSGGSRDSRGGYERGYR